MRHRQVLAAAAALAALAACGGSDGGSGPTPRTACSYGAYCNEYEGATLDVASTNATCTQGGATAMASCPQGALGLCTRQSDGTTIRNYYYEATLIDAMRTACTALGGAWSTP